MDKEQMIDNEQKQVLPYAAFIKKAGKQYKQMSFWLVAGLSLVILFCCRVSAACDDIIAQVVNPLVVSAIFSLVSSTAYGEAWTAIAKSSPANLAKFYLAASALKMMAAIVVFLIYVVVCSKQNILGFTAIFVLFYVLLLVFDCIFFARIEKKCNKNKEK